MARRRLYTHKVWNLNGYPIVAEIDAEDSASAALLYVGSRSVPGWSKVAVENEGGGHVRHFVITIEEEIPDQPTASLEG